MKFEPCVKACQLWASLFFISCLLPITLYAKEYPAPVGFVNDYYGLLEPQQRTQLDSFLMKIAQATSNEIVLLIMVLPEGEDFETYSGDLARAWGIGYEAKDNGILLAVYPDIQKIRIEIGYGLEGAIPDIVAKNVIDQDIVPDFKRNQPYAGISKGLATLAILAQGEYEEAEMKRYYRKSDETEGGTWKGIWTLIMIVVVVVFQVLRLGGGYGFSSSGGGSSGGGFGGFSGGSFGGGGASGAW